jgi:hypothetical protein
MIVRCAALNSPSRADLLLCSAIGHSAFPVVGLQNSAKFRPDDISCPDRAGVGAEIHRYGSAVGAALSGPGCGHHPHPDAHGHARGAFHRKLRFDDLLGVAAGGVGGNPAILAFGSKLVPTDRTNITYATVFPAATITKIVLVQVMLAMMGNHDEEMKVRTPERRRRSRSCKRVRVRAGPHRSDGERVVGKR